MAPRTTRRSTAAAAKASKIRLDGLPTETMTNVADRLGSDDLFALRATCKQIEAKTFHVFSTTHFTAKCIHMTTDSLKALLAMSQSKRLNSFVKTVWISVKRFDETPERLSCGHSPPAVG